MKILIHNNLVFGGYTACVWSQVQNYVQDDTISSFLFSQDQKLILPLKPESKHQAIYCHSSYGPTFGGYDMHISSNFQSGQSNLGTSYLIDEKQYGNQRQTLLLGAAQPNVMECEIYEITFQQ